MSQQAVADFVKKINEDRSLQKEFDSVVANNEDISATNQALADLGVKHGYEITAEDMEKLRLALKDQKGGADDELSEEELETVAGGFWTAVATGVVGILAADRAKKWLGW